MFPGSTPISSYFNIYNNFKGLNEIFQNDFITIIIVFIKNKLA